MRRFVPLLIVLACLLAPAAAGASARGGKKVLRECADTGMIANPGKYTHSDYEYALKHIASDLAEYTSCEDEIRRAQGAAERQRRGGGLGGGAAPGGGPPGGIDTSPPTPQETAAIMDATKRSAPVRIGGGAPVSAGGHGLVASGAAKSIPTSLLILLILLALAVLARAATTIRSHVIARRQA